MNDTILIVGQFPPPVTGFAYITQEMAKLTALRHTVVEIDLSVHRQRGGALYHARRLLLALRGAITLLRHASLPNRILYIACEGKLGLIYTIIIAATGRLFKYPLYLHHHNFNYIDKQSKLMALLIKVMGPEAKHIFLCQAMAERFNERYNCTQSYEVLSNSAFVPAHEVMAERPNSKDQPLTIGLLSNLTEEKGLGIFLKLLDAAKDEGLAIKGLLAGPAESINDKEAIARAQYRLGPRLTYQGPVYGESKDAFYQSIDAFIFPTRYANEAQPTVVYEAMAHGIPVLSYDRGCILSQIGTCGLALPKDTDFIPDTLAWLKQMLNSPDQLAKQKLDARHTFMEDHSKAINLVKNLFAK